MTAETFRAVVAIELMLIFWVLSAMAGMLYKISKNSRR